MARSKRAYPNPRPVAIDLFCGAGGMSLGFEQAGFDIVFAVDSDGHHAATHTRNFPECVTLCASVTALTGAQIQSLARVERPVDLVFGGPPCQGFSTMGHRDTRDARNTLVDEFVRLVIELSPRAFAMENVPGLGSGTTRPILERALTTLSAAGYAITTPIRALDAADFGVPQRRRRLFVLGVRADLDVRLEYPAGPCPGQPPRPTIVEAIADLPTVENNACLLVEDSTPYDSAPTSSYAQAARGTVPDPSDLSRPRAWNWTRCTGCLRINHSPRSVAIYAATAPGGTVPGHKLPRLDSAGICPTLRAGSDSARGSYTAPRPIHPSLPRCITAREAARLHGFPDWFAFYPLKWHAYRQIGNAVCPPVARAVGAKIVRALRCRTTTRVPKGYPVVGRFELPEARPRTLRRIPELREYPPVIDYLFTRAYDTKAARLRRTTFAFADVTEAIKSCGAKITWTREDTFLAEVSRSRNVRRILATPLRHGYSIMPATGGALGKFVPAGTPGTLDDKDEIQVKTSDLDNAVMLPYGAEAVGSGRAVELLARLEVRQALWSKAVQTVAIDATTDNGDKPGVFRYRALTRSGRASDAGVVLTCEPGAAPTRSRLVRLGRELKADRLLVILPLTQNHLLISRFARTDGDAREVRRTVYYLSGPDDKARK